MQDAGERYWRGFGKLESQSITEPRSGSDRVHHGYVNQGQNRFSYELNGDATTRSLPLLGSVIDWQSKI